MPFVLEYFCHIGSSAPAIYFEIKNLVRHKIRIRFLSLNSLFATIYMSSCLKFLLAYFLKRYLCFSNFVLSFCEYLIILLSLSRFSPFTLLYLSTYCSSITSSLLQLWRSLEYLTNFTTLFDHLYI